MGWHVLIGVLLFSANEPRSVLLLKSNKTALYEEVAAGFEATPAPETTLTTRFVPDNGTLEGVTEPGIVVVIGPTAAKYAVANYPHAEIIYTAVPEPEAIGLKGTRVHGVLVHVAPSDALRAFKQLLPRLKRVGIVHTRSRAALIARAHAAAAVLGLKLEAKEVEGEQDWPSAMASLGGSIDALWLVADSKLVTKRSYAFVAQAANENHWPLMVFSPALLKGGALISLEPDWRDVGRRAAMLIGAIGKGKASDEFPNAVVDVNRELAEQIGVQIPDTLAKRAP